MSPLDFNDADQQQNYECIPANTIVPLCLQIRPGGQGDSGWLTASKTSDAMMLSCEFTVTEGPYIKRKMFQYFVLSGGKTNEKGASIAGNISRATLRAILESARNILPDDMSDTAVNKLRVSGWQYFQGICFLAKLGIEKGQGNYADKNKIATVITPDMKEYVQPTQLEAAAQAPTQAPAASTPPPPANNPTPAWAR